MERCNGERMWHSNRFHLITISVNVDWKFISKKKARNEENWHGFFCNLTISLVEED